MNPRLSFDHVGHGLLGIVPESQATRNILSEEAFHKMISLERKRTERSHKPFLLMLLDMGKEMVADGEQSTPDKVLDVLSLGTRETDVVGWYKNDLIFGTMFTEVGLDGKEDILSGLLARLSTDLKRTLSVAQFGRIRISFYWFPEEWHSETPRKPNTPILYPDIAKRESARKCSRILKRAMDICGSVLALTLGCPIFALIALMIKLTSRGPILFTQQRVGQYGIPFPLLKFRSMIVNNNCSQHKEYVLQMIAGVAEKKPCNGNGNGKGQGVYKLTADPRITSVGAFLRKSSLDELPQFINVLKGEMSLVGPRPPLDYEVEKYDIWHRRRLMEVKPGITGLWQVNGRNRIAFDDMVRLDLIYAQAWSPWLDCKILLRTPKAVIAGAH